MKRRVYAPHTPMKPGMYVVWVFLKSGREYVWKGRARNEDVADMLAMKRLKDKNVMRFTSRLHG